MTSRSLQTKLDTLFCCTYCLFFIDSASEQIFFLLDTLLTSFATLSVRWGEVSWILKALYLTFWHLEPLIGMEWWNGLIFGKSAPFKHFDACKFFQLDQITLSISNYHFITFDDNHHFEWSDWTNCQALVPSPQVPNPQSRGLGLTIKSYGPPPHGRLHITTWPPARFHL